MINKEGCILPTKKHSYCYSRLKLFNQIKELQNHQFPNMH